MGNREKFGEIEVLHEPVFSFFIGEDDVDALEQGGHCTITRYGSAKVGELMSLTCGSRRFVARVESVIPANQGMIKIDFELIKESEPLPVEKHVEEELDMESEDRDERSHAIGYKVLRRLVIPKGLTITESDYPRIMDYETLIVDLSRTLFFLNDTERRKIAMKAGVIHDPVRRAEFLMDTVRDFFTEANALYFNNEKIPLYYTKDNALVRLIEGIRSGEIIVPKDFFDTKLDG